MKTDQTAEQMHDSAGVSPSLSSAYWPSALETSSSRQSEHLDSFARDTTIMMVDDATTTLKVLQAFLEDAGYQHFLPVSQPALAFQQLIDERPDVVLLDINMPGVSGFDILSFMRSRDELKFTPAIILTASTDAATKMRALNMGATDFLAKPVDESELVLRLRNTLIAKRYLDHQIYYDRVTGLANRRLFLDRLGRIVKVSERNSAMSAVILINIDRFKKVNDSLGHSVGDELLYAIGRRLDRLVRSNDAVCHPDHGVSGRLLARVGGDEFSLLLSDVKDAGVIEQIAEHLVNELAKKFVVQGRDLFLTASIGAAVYSQHGNDTESLLRRASIAVSHAKKKGKNCYKLFSSELEKASAQQLTLESELHRALERGEFLLHYQPKVDVRTGLVVGAETLVRWEHPVRGMVPPGEFIQVAEDAGLIGEIGAWILNEACRQNAAWHRAGLRGLQLAVNVSAHQLRDRGFIARVRKILEKTGLAPHCLTLELTEGVMLEEAKDNIDVLHALKDMGIRLSVDDFGTGYSSLSYLEQFPLDELKIDRSFVNKIDPNRGESPIVSAIIAMAHSLRFYLVAEGVETEGQLDFLRRNRCEFYQGYLFSKPLPADEFAELAGTWRPDRI